jgi:hypothetical protein
LTSNKKGAAREREADRISDQACKQIESDLTAQSTETQDRSQVLLSALYANLETYGEDSALLDAAYCMGAAMRFYLSLKGPEATFDLLAQAETELVAAVVRGKDAPIGRPN